MAEGDWTVFKHDAEEAKRRVEAWWCEELLDRPPLLVTAPADSPPEEPAPEPEPDTSAEIERWFTDPERVVPRLRWGLSRTEFLGESFPVMYPVATRMVAILGNYLGCPMRFVSTDTAWSFPILTDWEFRPPYRCDLDNRYWLISERLLREAVRRSDGYYVGLPDLNGPTEILSRLRSPVRLAMDFYDNAQFIKPALHEINRVWYGYWSECTRITQQLGGYFTWMGIWSDRPSVDLQSDFSCMMSSGMFSEYFLPAIAEQTDLVERTVYHLDGPDAIHHLEALLDLPGLTAIQWVPGAGSAPMAEWIELLRRIRQAGKLAYAACAPSEVERLLTEVGSRGLLLSCACRSRDEARSLLDRSARWM